MIAALYVETGGSAASFCDGSRMKDYRTWICFLFHWRGQVLMGPYSYFCKRCKQHYKSGI